MTRYHRSVTDHGYLADGSRRTGVLMTPIDLVPARLRSWVYLAALALAVVLVLVEMATGLDPLALVGRVTAVAVALLAVLHRPTRTGAS